jgi:GDPmannose 4,6-dehydratase
MKAFITGVTGQDGYYLSTHLLNLGYEVYGLVRRSTGVRFVPDGVNIVAGDVTDPTITGAIDKLQPDEVYNLAAISHVGDSFKCPSLTFNVNALGALNVLNGAIACHARFYQASTSELFGLTPPPQNEKSLFHPRSPYGVAKLAAYWLTVNARERGHFACNGILFNHESPRRGDDFVTQKVCKAALAIKRGEQDKLHLGNLNARRDWGHARDFVKGMWSMLQQDDPDDYVLATGVSHSIKDLLDKAFSFVNLDWRNYVEEDIRLLRPTDVNDLVGDYSKAETELGWAPTIGFDEMIEEMLSAPQNGSQ